MNLMKTLLGALKYFKYNETKYVNILQTFSNKPFSLSFVL